MGSCDICENAIGLDDFRWSCDSCGGNEEDYDLCAPCWGKGERCKHPSSHVLVKRGRKDLSLGERSKFLEMRKRETGVRGLE